MRGGAAVGESAAGKVEDVEEVGNRTYFYCDAYQLLWNSLDAAGLPRLGDIFS